MSTTGMWDELFGGGRKWRVAEELTGVLPEAGYDVTFDHGRFELPAGAAFRSLLSTNLGRRGAVLVETGPDGSADLPGTRIAVGTGAVDKARRDYGAIW
jgi:hypothetical protein